VSSSFLARVTTLAMKIQEIESLDEGLYDWRSTTAFPIQSSAPGKAESVSFHASVSAALGEGKKMWAGVLA